MRKQKGFSLIELLIVIAIILIIAAIAIPNLLRARIAANEASSVSSIRTINTAQATYVTGYPTTGYSATLAALGPGGVGAVCPAGGPVVGNACLIDSNLSNATAAANAKSGYIYDMAATAVAGINVRYAVGSAAASFNITGVRGFCSQEDAVIRFTASLNGAPINTNAACTAYTLLQ
jgi:type IV pilus assembly protein PilA